MEPIDPGATAKGFGVEMMVSGETLGTTASGAHMVQILIGIAKAATFILFPVLVLAQGGPPFRSDDPDTPGNKHWEINTGFIVERNALGGSYETPNIDINYGAGNRVQLKYEVPWNIQETRGDSNHAAAGLGNSLLGVKYRFYQRHSRTHVRDGAREIKFSASIYPQLVLNNPTRSVARGIAEPGPQLLLPLEANAKIDWIRVSGEVGYRFTSNGVPNSWIRGVVVGHEFKKDTELGLELYDQQDAQMPAGARKLRESTLGIGGRVPIDRRQSFRLIGMAGHGLVSATRTNGQPRWIAFVGIQFLSERRRRHGDE
jgi:hypothetical protein